MGARSWSVSLCPTEGGLASAERRAEGTGKGALIEGELYVLLSRSGDFDGVE